MDIENLIGSVVRGALTGKRKRRRGVTQYLTGGKGSFLNASTLLAIAGVAWGVYETATKKEDIYAGPSPAVPVPPVPVTGATAAPGAPSAPDVPADVLRLIRLTVSAARADGSLSPQEEAAIVEHARAVGAESIVQRELGSSFTLAQIVAGVTDPKQRDELYTLAFALVRGDEQVTGGERIYLAQLAHQLGLDAAGAARLEEEAARRIDAAAAEPEGPAQA